MKRLLLCLLALGLLSAVMIAGCTSNASSETPVTTATPTQDEEPREVMPESGDITGVSTITGETSGDGAGNSFFNIRIVPASELDKLQKEMGADDSLVKNDRDYVIGIISPRGLVIRGDLLQVEQEEGIVGREFDKTDVSLHLIDITFGLDNSMISLFKSDKDYKFWFDGYYTNTEVAYVKEIAKLLNSASGTTQFEDEEVALGFLQTNYEDVPYNFYNIKIITRKMLDKFYDDKKEKDHLFKDKDGKLIGIVNTDYLYLVDELSEDEEKYYILKGLLYSMGMHGISYKNTESFFYREEGKNQRLSDLDIEAIRLLYGGGLKSESSLEDTKKTLGLPV